MSTSTLSTKIAKPSHIPEHLVVDFNLYDQPELLEDLHGYVLKLTHNAPPIFWTPYRGGAWFIAGYDAVFKASRDPQSFTSEFISFEEVQALRAKLGPNDPHVLIPAPITMDPPIHTAYRAPLQGAFSPKAIAALRDDIRALCVSLIEEIKPNGECEFMSAIAAQLPVRIFLRMFGLPEEEQQLYRDLVHQHNNAREFSREKSQQMLHKLIDAMRDTILDRKANRRNDLISMLWSSTINGRPTDLNDIEDYCVVLFQAGLDTVTNGMGLGIRHFALHPELQAEVRANPSLIPEVTEELLRRYTFTSPPRIVAKDIEFEGVTMKKGEIAYLFLPAADLDASRFPNPEYFDLERKDKTHIAFGLGPHRCLGSHLARAELQILYAEFLARIPQFHIDPAKPSMFHGGTVIGPEKLWLRWII